MVLKLRETAPDVAALSAIDAPSLRVFASVLGPMLHGVFYASAYTDEGGFPRLHAEHSRGSRSRCIRYNMDFKIRDRLSLNNLTHAT